MTLNTSGFVRVIARMDIKGARLIKPVRLEGVRPVGDAAPYATRYAETGADELLLMDAVASLYSRNQLGDLIQKITESVFVPITVGGGIRSVEDARTALRCGADKIAVNTAAVQRPELIREISEEFGRQCVVLSIEAKRNLAGYFEVLLNGGRDLTSKNALDWIQEAVHLGAGEVLLTSVDHEGTRTGFDLEMYHALRKQVSVPLILSGGFGNATHLDDLIASGPIPEALAFADALHFNRLTIPQIKTHLSERSLSIRPQPLDGGGA